MSDQQTGCGGRDVSRPWAAGAEQHDTAGLLWSVIHASSPLKNAQTARVAGLLACLLDCLRPRLVAQGGWHAPRSGRDASLYTQASTFKSLAILCHGRPPLGRVGMRGGSAVFSKFLKLGRVAAGLTLETAATRGCYLKQSSCERCAMSTTAPTRATLVWSMILSGLVSASAQADDAPRAEGAV